MWEFYLAYCEAGFRTGYLDVEPAADDPGACVDLSGKTAWVVGASSGIGAALARELVDRGATVAICARRRDELERVSGGGMLVVPADVTDAAACPGRPTRSAASSAPSTSWSWPPATGSS